MLATVRVVLSGIDEDEQWSMSVRVGGPGAARFGVGSTPYSKETNVQWPLLSHNAFYKFKSLPQSSEHHKYLELLLFQHLNTISCHVH